MSGDIVATWNVPLQAQCHKVEFEHGTTTGKRVIRVDGKEVLRRDWMFKLVGKEEFSIGKIRCSVTVAALGTFAYEYGLEVNGKEFSKFREDQSKTMVSWEAVIGGQDFRIVLDKNAVTVWANGADVETAGEFAEGGSIIHFSLANTPCRIEATSSGKKKVGVVHSLYVNNSLIPSDQGRAGTSS